MAIGKRVKQGGSYFQGFQLVVSTGIGNYTQDVVLSNQGCAVNSITLTPISFGDGDYLTVQHLNVDGNVDRTLGDTVYNLGAGVSIMLDFAALEVFDAGEKLRLIYTNVAGVAMNVYFVVERIR